MIMIMKMKIHNHNHNDNRNGRENGMKMQMAKNVREKGRQFGATFDRRYADGRGSRGELQFPSGLHRQEPTSPRGHLTIFHFPAKGASGFVD